MNAARLFVLAALLAQPPAPRPPAAVTPPISAPQAVDAAALDRAIERVLAQREYAWRLPPADPVARASKGWFASAMEAIGRWCRAGFHRIGRAISKFLDWLFGNDWQHGEEGAGGGGETLQLVVYVLIAVAAGLIGWAGWSGRWWRRRSRIVEAQAVEAAPDLRSEEISADQLPEERWRQLARELLEKGDLRLSLRASYLAGLAHLGERQLLAIARHKSNLDYRRELARRAVQRRELVAAFEENVSAFERVWYGRNPATLEALERFGMNLELIRAQ